MSLLSETVNTVIQGQFLNIDNAFNAEFARYPNLRYCQVITGALVPRDVDQDYLVVDNKTLDPVLLPANSIIINVVVAPTIPLESSNLGSAQVSFYLYDNTLFDNRIDWPSHVLNGNELQAIAFTRPNQDGGLFSDYTEYHYIGGKVLNTAFTAGQLQVYVYYLTAHTPPL